MNSRSESFRAFVRAGAFPKLSALVSAAAFILFTGLLHAHSPIAPTVTVYTAREILTLDADHSVVSAVAVAGSRIVGTGSLDTVLANLGDRKHVIDERFKNQTIVPGFIAQHDHPLLTALTMTSEIIAIEDWALLDRTIPAARDHKDYLQRLRAAEQALETPDDLLLTWGYHGDFHGDLNRAELDGISSTRPIIIWHRSCHEMILNTRALELATITPEWLSDLPETARQQLDYEQGHFWEQGLFDILPKMLPVIATPGRLKAGLEFMIRYFHANGITLAAEPGGVLSRDLQRAQNAALSPAETPFRFYFIPDGKSLVAAYGDQAVAETANLLDWGEGMTSILPGQVKLFADGAIYSQLMQVRDPYTDGHEGEWLMEPELFTSAFAQYWDAGYQIHVHVNGDAGLDMVLNALESSQERTPREDHRTVIVHFAVSTSQQVDRSQRLGALVSANPYYPVALADSYRESGLGPERADPMVRLGDLERRGLSYSLHSDMPMAPAQPLFLMHSAVNRVTASGRVTAPEQRASPLGALRAITLDAAYSLQQERDVGSIEAGKLANFTVLGANPLSVERSVIKDIPVRATVHEGRVFPIR